MSDSGAGEGEVVGAPADPGLGPSWVGELVQPTRTSPSTASVAVGCRTNRLLDSPGRRSSHACMPLPGTAVTALRIPAPGRFRSRPASDRRVIASGRGTPARSALRDPASAAAGHPPRDRHGDGALSRVQPGLVDEHDRIVRRGAPCLHRATSKRGGRRASDRSASTASPTRRTGSRSTSSLCVTPDSHGARRLPARAQRPT